MVWKTEDNKHKWCAEVDGLESWRTDKGDFHRPWHAYDFCEKQVLPDTDDKGLDRPLELWKIHIAPLPQTLPSSLPADVPYHCLYLLLHISLPSSGA